MTDVAFVAAEEDEGARLDAAVARRFELSRSAVQEAVRTGAITVEGGRVKASHRLAPGEHIEGSVEVKKATLPEAEDIPLVVRYSDEHVLVIDKPAGLVTHPGAGNQAGTLVNALLARGEPLSEIDPTRPGVVHRLDKETSGLLVVARDDATHRHLVAALAARTVERRYLALVRGVPAAPSATIEAPIGRHPRARLRMTVTPDGKQAVTHVATVAVGDRCALVEATLETGRTHQIRVHLAHIGHPVLGDGTYGGRGDLSLTLGLTRPFLHAHHLSFTLPDGTPVSVDSELPADLSAALAAAGVDPPG